MKKINNLLQKIQSFEKLAIYSNRTVFLNKLAQEADISDALTNNESNPESYPELRTIVDQILSTNSSTEFDVEDLTPLATQLNTELNKNPMDLKLVLSLVGQILANTQEGELHQEANSVYFKLKNNLKTQENTQPQTHPSKSNPQPRYFPVSPKFNLKTDDSVISANQVIQQANKVLADWKNPLMLANQNDLLNRSHQVVSQLNKEFSSLSAKAESIESIPSASSNEKEQDKKDLVDIENCKSTITQLITQFSNLNSSGRMSQNSPK